MIKVKKTKEKFAQNHNFENGPISNILSLTFNHIQP